LNKYLKWFFFPALFLVLLIALIPTIASTSLGKPFFTRWLESKSHGKVEIGKLSLSWLGPQKFKDIQWSRDGVVAVAPELQIKAPFWSFSGPFLLENGSISYKNGKIENIESKLEGNDFSLTGVSADGHIDLKGEVISEKKFNIGVEVKNFPTIVIDHDFSKIVGPTLDLQGRVTEKLVNLDIHSLNFETTLLANWTNEGLTLDQPLRAAIKLTPHLSEMMLKNTNPLLITGLYAEKPLILNLSNQNFLLPLPYSLKKLSARGILEVGEVFCRNGKTLASIASLIDIKISSMMRVWCTPISFQIIDGIMKTTRMDALVSDHIHVCTWGEIDLINDQIKMELGLNRDTLEKYFGLKNLPINFVIPIPIRGTTSNPQINGKKALSQIAKAFLFKQDGIPPAKRPFPWEKK